MTFFNKSEDVLKIELTPHGRKLLSQGKLKPAYYAFYDDDIVYDAERGGITENNSQTKNRILVETPCIKPQRAYFGIDTNLNNNNFLENSRTLMDEIGTNSHVEKQSPSWEINFLRGEISSSAHVLTSSKNSLLRIPQIECEINYTMSVKNENDFGDIFSNIDYITRTPSKNDGTFVEIKEEGILMHILEKNGFDYKDALEIEVFMYEHDSGQNRITRSNNNLEDYTLRRLTFLEPNNTIENDLLVTTPATNIGISSEYEMLSLITTDNVEYYLDISLDSLIPRNEICKSIKKVKSNNPYLDVDLECDDEDITKDINIYPTSITQQDIEDCE